MRLYRNIKKAIPDQPLPEEFKKTFIKDGAKEKRLEELSGTDR